MRPVDAVLLHGWSPDTTRRAIAALTDASTKTSGEPRKDEDELATELLRWLRCAAEADAAGLVEHLEDLRPSGAEASQWERLDNILDKAQSLDDTIAELKEIYADPVTVLCTLLDETDSSSAQFSDLDRTYQRAVEVLIALGSHETLRYLMSHIGLLCWNNIEPLGSLIKPHHGVLIGVAAEVWPDLAWGERVILVLLFSECGLPKDSLLDLALATDASLLTYDERGAFVEVLAFTEDARAEVRIHKLIETALDEASSYRSDEVVRFIEFTAHTLLYEVEREFPPEQYRRAVELGFTFSRRSTVVDRLAGAEREFFDFQGID